MAIKLHEVHPALVHFPIALLPVSVAADLLGRLTGSEELLDLGRRTMPLAAVSGLVAGVAGLMAQTEVETDEESLAILKTHRTLNLGLVAIAGAMSAYRAKRERPSVGYLALGIAGFATMAYSAFLGGSIVYRDGVGVDAADGVRQKPAVPELKRETTTRALRTAASDLAEGIQLTVKESAKGDLVPSLTARKNRNRLPEGEAASG